MTTPNPFGTASPPGGDGPEMKELEGKLILIDVASIEHGIVTKFGSGDAVKCSLVELDGASAGTSYASAALWGTVLTTQFVVGTKYVGRIVKGTPSQPGHNAPWLWQNGNEADIAAGVKYLTYANSQAVSTQAAPPVQDDPWAAPPATPVAAPAAPVATPVAAPAAPDAAKPPWL